MGAPASEKTSIFPAAQQKPKLLLISQFIHVTSFAFIWNNFSLQFCVNVLCGRAFSHVKQAAQQRKEAGKSDDDETFGSTKDERWPVLKDPQLVVYAGKLFQHSVRYVISSSGGFLATDRAEISNDILSQAIHPVFQHLNTICNRHACALLK